MNGTLIPIFGIIFVIGLPIIGSLLFVHKLAEGKHKERLAMIEKGIIVDDSDKSERRASKYNALRNGLVMIGLAIGALAGIVVNSFCNTWEGEFLIFVMAVLGGGIAFVIYFFIARKMQKEEKPLE
ncbi:MAG: DUF4231 domain-containing protein [Tannerellaceae bacterium]|jgi:uncharacterized membrane protein|nr:DUF4231 domain-containing protein [Tannerellaceae bacterium]